MAATILNIINLISARKKTWTEYIKVEFLCILSILTFLIYAEIFNNKDIFSYVDCFFVMKMTFIPNHSTYPFYMIFIYLIYLINFILFLFLAVPFWKIHCIMLHNIFMIMLLKNKAVKFEIEDRKYLVLLICSTIKTCSNIGSSKHSMFFCL